MPACDTACTITTNTVGNNTPNNNKMPQGIASKLLMAIFGRNKIKVAAIATT
mgnify:CR=1 FL=1